MRDGAELRPLPPGQRTLLGLLALAPGSPVQLDAIADALWAERTPLSAVNIIATYVSRLRSALDADVPPNDGAGYRLHVTEDELDLLAFRRLVAQARKARAVGQLDQACAAYEQALGLWRGEPLDDIEPLHRHPAVVALAAERTATVLDYADAAVGNDQVLPHLRALAVREPLNEAAHARLMIALAVSGRQADALCSYEETRRRLDEELGVVPGPALRAAHAQVLHQDIKAMHPAGVWQPVFQLPAAPADFTGRAVECGDLTGAIRPGGDHPGVPLAAISGPPGVGKTSLALYVAHMNRERFPDGQLWVQLAGSSARPREPGDVLGELLRALGLPGSAIPEGHAERSLSYRSRLAGRRILVVADDAATAAQVRPLLPGTAGSALIVTSRSRMEGLDGAHLLPLDVLSAEDAVGLLAKIVGAGRVAAERSATEELVQACEALPLALRIAGAKLAVRPSWPLSAMVRRLTSKYDRLRELQAGDMSVRASIASSYESLPERPRRAFALLALIGPLDFVGWVVGAVLGDDEASDVIDELVARSLLIPLSADATGEPRYRLHDLLREYAAERLAAMPVNVVGEARERLTEGWLQLAQLADNRLPPDPFFPLSAPGTAIGPVPRGEAERLTADPLTWFTAERANLMAAFEQACEASRLNQARQLASHQCAFQHLEDRHDDAERMWRTIADWPEPSDDRAAITYARLRVCASMVERGYAVDALPVLEECVAEVAKSGDSEILALALYWQAACAFDIEDYQRARHDAERGVGVARKSGSRFAEFMNLRILGSALACLGDVSDGVAASESALCIAADLGVSTYELIALHTLAFAYARAHQYESAVRVCLRRIDLSRELGDVRAEGNAYGVLGDIYQGMGKYELAVASLLRALPVFRDHQVNRHLALCLQKLGAAYEKMKAYPQAVACLEESMAKFRELRLHTWAEQAQQALDRCQAASLAHPEVSQIVT